MLTLTDFTKYYGDTLILSIPDLTISSGVYWIKGHNGSGKSTLFKSIAGLIPCSGQIVFDDGVSLHQHPVRYRKRVNYSEAEPIYPGYLTAKDLIHFVGQAKSAPKGQQTELIEQFGIDRYFEKPCQTYSSGMLKKLSLAMAFLGKPSVVILDEPFITLDEAARQALLALIRHHVSSSPISFLISSHQLIAGDDVPVKAVYSIQHQTLEKL